MFVAISIFPASHYVTSKKICWLAHVKHYQEELDEHEEYLKWFLRRDGMLAAERISQRTNYDMEMMMEVRHHRGVENYSEHELSEAWGETL